MNITEAKLEPIVDVRLRNFNRTCNEVMLYLFSAFKTEFVSNQFKVQTYYRSNTKENFSKETGIEHKFLCSIPIGREIIPEYEYNEWSTHSRMDAGSAIFIYYEVFVIDGKVNREYFDVQTSNLFKKDNERYGGERILYHLVNGTGALFGAGHVELTDKAYLQIHKHVKSVLEDVQILNKIERFKSKGLSEESNL